LLLPVFNYILEIILNSLSLKNKIHIAVKQKIDVLPKIDRFPIFSTLLICKNANYLDKN